MLGLLFGIRFVSWGMFTNPESPQNADEAIKTLHAEVSRLLERKNSDETIIAILVAKGAEPHYAEMIIDNVRNAAGPGHERGVTRLEGDHLITEQRHYQRVEVRDAVLLLQGQIVEGKHFDHPALIQEKRSRMKIMLFDPSKDLPVKAIVGILHQALRLYNQR